MQHTMFQRFLILNMIFILYYLLHMKMKKMLLGAFLWVFALAGIAVLPNYANATGGNAGEVSPTGNGEGSEGDTYRDEPSADMIWDHGYKGSQLLTTIKKAINWLLWILATITLVIMLYAGFLMVTSAGDEKKYSSGVTILKYAAIWLAIIWLSWLIVSVIFRFINLNAGDAKMTKD